MPFGRKSPKPGMLGSGMAFKAGSAVQLRREIQDLELRQSDPGYIPTAEEQSRLAQLRGELEAMMMKRR